MEEDIVANWLLTHAFNSAGGVAAPSAEELDRFANGAFRCIHNAWGLRRESRTGNVTRQGVDYTRDGVKGVDYADVWVVPGVRLSRKESCERSDQRWLDHSDQFEANLYFAAAPNAGRIGTSAGSMARTFNRRASIDEDRFMDGVTACAGRSAHPCVPWPRMVCTLCCCRSWEGGCTVVDGVGLGTVNASYIL